MIKTKSNRNMIQNVLVAIEIGKCETKMINLILFLINKIQPLINL